MHHTSAVRAHTVPQRGHRTWYTPRVSTLQYTAAAPPSLPPSAAGLRGSVVTHLAHEPAKGAQAHLCERVGIN